MGLEVRNIVGNIRDNLENTSGDTSGGIRNWSVRISDPPQDEFSMRKPFKHL